MAAEVESLNTAVATAAILFEVVRQRAERATLPESGDRSGR
jgi:tRNA G18 (ribose-2'-O)-methylase SpoU